MAQKIRKARGSEASASTELSGSPSKDFSKSHARRPEPSPKPTSDSKSFEHEDRKQGDKHRFDKKKEYANVRGKKKVDRGCRWFSNGEELKSFIIKWMLSIAVVLCVFGVFALKAAEEYYGQDEDTGGQETMRHLAALDLYDAASESEIRKSYRTLSVRWHPDKNPDCPSCHERFQEVASAYEFLMKGINKNKQRKAEHPTNRENGDFQMNSQGIVDFSDLGPSEKFFPATDTKNVWCIMLHQDKDEWSKEIYDLWQESARFMDKYVKYGVITVHKNRAILKQLPINVKVLPTIMLMTGGMYPELYTFTYRPSLEHIRRFISDHFPNFVHVAKNPQEVGAFLSSPQSEVSPLAAPYKVVVLPSASSTQAPSLLLKFEAFARKNFASFCYVPAAHQMNKEDLLKEIENAKPWMGERPSQNTRVEFVHLPLIRTPLKTLDLSSNSVFLFFADEGQGLTLAQQNIPAGKNALANLKSAVDVILGHFQQFSTPYLFEQNSLDLCKGSADVRAFCVVVVEPPYTPEESNTQKMEVVDVALMKELLAASTAQYEKEKTRLPSMSEVSDDLHEEEAEEVHTDVSINVQVVRLSFNPPSSNFHLPGISSASPMFKFWSSELQGQRVFLLDLGSDRFAPLPLLRKAEDSAAARAVYANLHKTLEDVKNESNAKNFKFNKLPNYCDAKRFTNKCLPSASPPWWKRILNSILSLSLLQLITCIALIGAAFFLRHKMSPNIFIVAVLLGSLALGLVSHLQSLMHFIS